VPDAVTIDRSLAKKIAGTVRLITSNKPGDVTAATEAFVRLLQGAGNDVIHAIAERIENESNGKLSDAELKEVFDAGVDHGKKLSAQAQAQTQQAHPQLPSAYTMAMYCLERIDRLDDKHHDFISKMSRTARRYALSPKQQTYLEDLYLQLGGSI